MERASILAALANSHLFTGMLGMQIRLFDFHAFVRYGNRASRRLERILALHPQRLGNINYAQLAVHKPRSLYAAIEVLGLLQRFVSCGIIRASIKIRFADGGCQHVYHADIPLKYRERIVAEFLKKPL